MTASRTPSEPVSDVAGPAAPVFVSPVIDYEPPPLDGLCQVPTPAALHRRTPRPLRRAPAYAREPLPPRDAVVFADAGLRRVLEGIDRRRPLAQLRPLVAPALIDTVVALARVSHAAAATLRRVRVRMVDADAAEVFGTYTRGQRVLAIAARIELHRDRWRIVALQLG